MFHSDTRGQSSEHRKASPKGFAVFLWAAAHGLKVFTGNVPWRAERGRREVGGRASGPRAVPLRHGPRAHTQRTAQSFAKRHDIALFCAAEVQRPRTRQSPGGHMPQMGTRPARGRGGLKKQQCTVCFNTIFFLGICPKPSISVRDCSALQTHGPRQYIAVACYLPTFLAEKRQKAAG